jgi:hypothetical protein
VEKQASSLSVANAQTLAGRPASAYQERAIVYTVTVPDAVDDVEAFRLDIQPGTYAFTWSAHLYFGSGTSACFLRRQRGGEEFGVASDQTTGAHPAMSGAGVMEVATGDVIDLYCYSGSNFVVGPSEPIQVVATPLDSVTAGYATYTP